jgi:CspA family cold shock protein
MKGKIKKLVMEKGFGFIQSNDNKDIFFHHSCVDNQQFDELAEGQLVEYTIDDNGSSAKGPRAATVRPVDAGG